MAFPGARAAAALLLALAAGPTAARAGNLTSPAELEAVADSADRGVVAARDMRDAIHAAATVGWRWGSVSGSYVTTLQSGDKICHPANDPGRADYLKEGAPDAYAKALAYHLRAAPDADARLALAAEARDRVLDLVDTEGFHGLLGQDWSGANQCILELAISVPVWIETAQLLEDTPVWDAADTRAFADWLAVEVYPKVAWASRVRRNNWGAAGSLSASLVARYLSPFSPDLLEVEPAARSLVPAAAWAEHEGMQLARIGTSWPGDSDCARYGIQDDGGIPDELRRGAGGCSASAIPSQSDAALSYQTMHVELLVLHAEALRRSGDDMLYAARTRAGDPAIRQAILFVIDNPSGPSWSWGVRTGALHLAYRYYGDPRLEAAAQAGSSFRGGRTLPYARLTPPIAPRLLD